MSDRLSAVDLALAAANMCHYCRDYGRPKDESSQDQGDSFTHAISANKTVKCEADQIWHLIRRLGS